MGAIAISVLISMLILLVEHFLPWRAMNGKELGRLSAYMIGVLALILPLSGLVIYWGKSIQYELVLAAIWAHVVCGGLAVIAAHGLDGWLITRARMHVAEKEARRLRGNYGEAEG